MFAVPAPPLPIPTIPSIGLNRNFDQQTAVVACTPLVNPVEGTNQNTLVEAARRESVVELAVGLCRGLPRRPVCWHVSRVARNLRLRRHGRPAVRKLRPEEFQPERPEALPDRPLPVEPRREPGCRVVEIQVARGDDAMMARVRKVDEGGQVRKHAMC